MEVSSLKNSIKELESVSFVKLLSQLLVVVPAVRFKKNVNNVNGGSSGAMEKDIARRIWNNSLFYNSLQTYHLPSRQQGLQQCVGCVGLL